MAFAGSTKAILCETNNKLRSRKIVCQNSQQIVANSNSNSNSKISTKADRRRRAFSLEARQIKRAHRHLLTSEIDLQKNNRKKSLSTSKIAAAVSDDSSTLSCCTTSARRNVKKKNQQKQQQQQQQQQNNKLCGLENSKVEKSKEVNKAGKKKRNSRHKAKNRDDNISERWHSIERKIEQLEQLLHVCDVCYDTDSTMDNETESDLQSTTSSYDSIPISLVPSSLKRRGHQHHPRFAGSRVPANVQQIVNAISLAKEESEEQTAAAVEETVKTPKRRHGKANKQKEKLEQQQQQALKTDSLWPETDIENECEKSIDEGIELDDEGLGTEWSKLRCTSESVEVVAERETRRNKQRCADYPGLAFARSIFSSDTMMKFNIIRNELHNIMKTQLKRVNNAHNKHEKKEYNQQIRRQLKKPQTKLRRSCTFPITLTYFRRMQNFLISQIVRFQLKYFDKIRERGENNHDFYRD